MRATWGKVRGQGQSFQALSVPTLLAPPHVHQLGSSHNVSFVSLITMTVPSLYIRIKAFKQQAYSI